MAVRLDVQSNIKSFSRNLSNFASKQVPDATRSTLNNVAKDLRNHIITKTFPKSFTKRNKTFPKLLFKFTKANRRNLESSVEQKNIDGRYFEAISKSASGGIRRGKGRRIAVPTSNIRLTAKGVRKNRRPRNVISSRRGFIEGNKIFLQKNRSKLELLYILKNFIKIKKTFPFEEDSRKFVNKNLPKIFGKALEFRIAIARMR
jgi:hypothetical protein